MEIANSFLDLTMNKCRIRIEENPIEDVDDITSVQMEANNTTATPVAKMHTPEAGEGLKSALLTDIKAAIYNYSHPSVSGVTTTYGSSFDEICTKLGIGPGKSITKADLTKLTRNDSEEDANSDFCGGLNRAFSYLSPNDKISYNDLMLFFMRGAGSDNTLNLSEYKVNVNNYANIVQQQFEACSTAQQKLEFAIEKTRDYLTESRMDLQLNALTRLTTEPVASQNVPNPDTSTYPDAVVQDAHVGQIALADLGGSSGGIITLGSYATTLYYMPENKFIPAGATDKEGSYILMWAGDADGGWSDPETGETGWNDGGLTLNSTYYLSGIKWYDLVATLVHELTHATAYYYYDVSGSSVSFSDAGLTFMQNLGFFDDTKSYKTDEEFNELIYTVNAMWDEWPAYTTSCNYWDSIGEDVFKTKQDLAVNGTEEKAAIKTHLENTGYNGLHTNDDGSTEYYIRPDPITYMGWDYDTFQNMFYFDLNA